MIRSINAITTWEQKIDEKKWEEQDKGLSISNILDADDSNNCQYGLTRCLVRLEYGDMSVVVNGGELIAAIENATHASECSNRIYHKSGRREF